MAHFRVSSSSVDSSSLVSAGLLFFLPASAVRKGGKGCGNGKIDLRMRRHAHHYTKLGPPCCSRGTHCILIQPYIPSPAPESCELVSLGCIHLPHISSWRLTAFSASDMVVSVMIAKMRFRISASSIAMAAPGRSDQFREGLVLLAG
jgi:hypothetical protein